MAGHEHVYGICENKCMVEVPTKAQFDAETEVTDFTATFESWLTAQIPSWKMPVTSTTGVNTGKKRKYRITVDTSDTSPIGNLRILLPLNPFPAVSGLKGVWVADVTEVEQHGTTVTVNHKTMAIEATSLYNENNYSNYVIHQVGQTSDLTGLVVYVELSLYCAGIPIE